MMLIEKHIIRQVSEGAILSKLIRLEKAKKFELIYDDP
jgi:hypothetical protein